MKGEKGCQIRHIEDGVFYKAFVSVFNVMVENKDYFLDKWQERLKIDNILQRYKVRQFIRIITSAKQIREFNVDLYFALVEKMTVDNGCKIIVSMLDGTEVECEIE